MQNNQKFWDYNPKTFSFFLLRKRKNTVNLKVIQYVKCHSDAQITMNVYNHIAEKSHVANEMSKMNLQETVSTVV